MTTMTTDRLSSDLDSMGDSTAMVGSDSTLMPSSVEAAAAVPKVVVSELIISSTVIEAGMEMVAVMRTLAAATLIVTSDLSTPAASATFCCQLDVSLSEKSLTLPLAVSVSTTDSVEGGGGAFGDELGEGEDGVGEGGGGEGGGGERGGGGGGDGGGAFGGGGEGGGVGDGDGGGGVGGGGGSGGGGVGGGGGGGGGACGK